MLSECEPTRLIASAVRKQGEVNSDGRLTLPGPLALPIPFIQSRPQPTIWCCLHSEWAGFFSQLNLSRSAFMTHPEPQLLSDSKCYQVDNES